MLSPHVKMSPLLWLHNKYRVEKIFHSFAALTRELFFNTRREIWYLRAAMYYPLFLGTNQGVSQAIYSVYFLASKSNLSHAHQYKH